MSCVLIFCIKIKNCFLKEILCPCLSFASLVMFCLSPFSHLATYYDLEKGKNVPLGICFASKVVIYILEK